jgi:glycosyltransferase involved in cell wall biosynthesis
MVQVSIITPSLNRADMIADAIESVLEQNYSDFEHIIVDGGSTDGTSDLLKRYPHLKVISEPDRGMYDSLNKGLMLAQGEWIGFLNTDDQYAAGVFAEVEKHNSNETILALAGDAEIFVVESDSGPRTLNTFSPVNKDLLTLSTLDSPYFNAWFFRRTVFKEIGCFNVDYRIVADRDFMLRFALSDLKYQYLHKLVYRYRRHESSLTFEVTNQKLANIVDEHLDLTRQYLIRSDISPHAKTLLRKFRTRDTVEMAWIGIKTGRFAKALHYAAEGTKYDLFWIGGFIKRMIISLKAGLIRIFRNSF